MVYIYRKNNSPHSMQTMTGYRPDREGTRPNSSAALTESPQVRNLPIIEFASA
jgi:hypothetical protein